MSRPGLSDAVPGAGLAPGRVLRHGLALAVALAVAGCASVPGPAPVERRERLPEPLPAPVLPVPGSAPATQFPPPTPPGEVPRLPDEREIRATVARLLPSGVRDRAGWAGDLYTAFAHIGLPHAPSVYCAAIAVIEQESSFQADPAVPGLPGIVRRELESRAGRYGVPRLLVKAALQKTSPDGRSYDRRIDALKTEKQLSQLFDDMIAELPAGRQLLAGHNPVRTGGPMQVSVAFAEDYVRLRPYPYAGLRSVRDEVFSRRGGVYFGSAILLDYPAPYDDPVYRFADFNAGRYASRNAAFQQALARVSGKPLVLDGDLLRYRDGQPDPAPSTVELALRGLAGRLRLSPGEIRRDLLLEKGPAFAQSPLASRLFALADGAAGQPVPRQAMPRIDLKSPKITRQLTTEWFARRVEGRYRQCLGRV